MTKIERVDAAINRKPVDRTCYSFRAEDDALEKLYRHLGFRDYDILLDMLDSDILLINADYPREISVDGVYQNCWGERYIYKDTEFGPVREDCGGALENASSLHEMELFKLPSFDEVNYSHLAEKIARHPDMAVQYGTADIWQRPGMVRGTENFLVDMAINPEICHCLSQKFLDFFAEDFKLAQTAVSGKIKIFTLYSDIGTQNGTMISRDMLKEFVLPYVRKLADVVHNLGGKLFFHSCGMIFPFIGDLIDSGVDILDPIQPCSPEMQPESLMKAYGHDVCFHGGIDVQNLLTFGTPKEVRETVKRYSDCFQNGGYICAPSHFLQSNANAENMLAVYNEIRKKD